MIPKDTLFSNIKLVKKRSAFTLELFRTIKDFSFANDIFLFRKLQISSLFRKLRFVSPITVSPPYESARKNKRLDDDIKAAEAWLYADAKREL